MGARRQGSMYNDILGDDSSCIYRNIRGESQKDWKQKDVFEVRKQVSLRLNQM